MEEQPRGSRKLYKELRSGQGKHGVGLEQLVAPERKDDGNPKGGNMSEDTGANLKEIPFSQIRTI